MKIFKFYHHFLQYAKTDKFVCVVTEYVEPLERYLQNISDYTQQQKQLAISYGLLQVAVRLINIDVQRLIYHSNHFAFNRKASDF